MPSTGTATSTAPAPRPGGRAGRRRRRWPLRVLLIAAALVLAGAATAVVVGLMQPREPEAPGVGSQFVVPTESSAARAVAEAAPGSDEGDAAAYLATQPTAWWLTPERDPIGAVGARIDALAAEAQAQAQETGEDTAIAVVVYGLPERDCGNHSAGGLDAADYDIWTTEIATALAAYPDLDRVVVLEPDSLSLAEECGNLDERVIQLRAVIAKLQLPGIWVYLDGGHSNWHPAAEQARLLQAVGVDGVRGFALNVSNFNPASDEFAYAHSVAAELQRLAPGADPHALIDTSRSGSGSNGEWCNPPGRTVGEVAGTFGDEVVDTNLWIKVPGESDGPCNGGPEAGQWWPAAAVELTRDARG